MFNKYLIYGLGSSGLETAKFLLLCGYDVFAIDDDCTKMQNLQSDMQLGYQKIKFLSSLQDFVFDNKTAVIFAPGIPLYYPKQHKIVDICKNSGAYLMTDIELFYLLNQNNNFIGITGTNGKSTTTSLIGFILSQLNIPNSIGGNIGTASFLLPQNKQNYNYVLELSSFQLDLINKTRLNIACLLNITPDHIDRHGDMQNYIAAKKRIFAQQTNQDYAVICIDNSINKSITESWNFVSKLVLVSNNIPLNNGITLINNKLSVNFAGYSFNKIVHSQYLLGLHNQQNIVVAFAVIFAYFLNKNIIINEQLLDEIIAAILAFTGLKHRLQIVAKKNNITFVNDSKATNADSTSNALQAYDNIFWILGGRAKEGGIKSLVQYFSKIKKAYLIGEASNDFAKILQDNAVDFVLCEKLDNAFLQAYNDAKNVGYKCNIILSPACASFDQWANFEHRGDYFCKLVHDL